ncbi:hypothetical protein AX15_000741 [Amanita polypyramis BW_CC]|nr:hypothetical protein AX15_000741 [Amanita polypyramis BW_CC]
MCLLQNTSEIRYWSDFSRVFYDPNSLHPVPDAAYGELEHGDWKGNSELFSRYNENNSLMEDSVRLFLEECDYFQGLHVVNDVDTFGGFTNSFLTAFRDDLSKASSLAVPVLSGASFDLPDVSDPQATRSIINDALYVRSLSEIASMCLPVGNPMSWPLNSWSHLMNFNQSIYHLSAVISTHLESSTLPLRLRRPRDSLSDFCARAKQYGVGSFCQLSGYVPVIPSTILGPPQFSFSATSPELDAEEWTRIDVTRGFSPELLGKYDQWCSDTKLKGTGTVVSSVHAFAYPLPSSYPAIFGSSYFTPPPYKGKHAPPTISVLSSISNNSGTANMFLAYAEYVQNALRLGRVDASMGLETDEFKDLVNDLWTLHDNYPSRHSYADEGGVE